MNAANDQSLEEDQAPEVSAAHWQFDCNLVRL